MRWVFLILLLRPLPSVADTLVAAHTIRAQSLITARDVAIKDVDVPGALTAVQAVIGQEARVSLYAGRAIRPGDVGPPAVVERNQIITLIYDRGGLQISTEGRSLARAGSGETVRAMNLASRITISGRALPGGRVLVSD